MAGIESLLNAYPIALALILASGPILVIAGMRSPHRPAARRNILRLMILWGAIVVAILIGESFAAISLAWQHRMPAFASGIQARRPAAAGDQEDINLVVVGESSAEGVPYRDWLSVGRIVTWRLRTAIPDRMFHVEVQARAGWTLEQMHQKMAEIKKAPDALIIYAGHNEFASRYGWSHEVPYYDDDRALGRVSRAIEWLAGRSPFRRLIEESLQRERVAMRPPPSNRRLVDAPSFSAEQGAERLDDFRRRLESMVSFCKRAGILAILVIPPGNDAGFEPNRSILPPETPRADRDEFARAIQEAMQLEKTEPIRKSIGRYRDLIARRPGFAEAHFRLARLLEREGERDGAYESYVRARDLDGHPMRCPSSFQDIYRDLARRYDAILIDGQAVLRARSPVGQLDDRLFNDAFHPSFEGQIALAEAILAALKDRGAFGWPETAPAPPIDPEECARHFDVTRAAWRSAADFAAGFYGITAPIRFDAVERLGKQRRYAAVVRSLAEGREADSLRCPGIGTKPIQDDLKP